MSLIEFWSDATSESDRFDDDHAVEFAKCTKPLMVKKNICYIVGAIILRGHVDNLEILMIQEVGGDWYIPAGRMEAGETIEEGMKREVLEEAGVECQAIGLLAFEHTSGWYRYTYLAQHTGRNLKTVDERDSESIQARWVLARDVQSRQFEQHHNIRHLDMYPLIDLGVKRFAEKTSFAKVIHRPVPGLFARVVVLKGNLVLQKEGRLPMIEHGNSDRLPMILTRFLSDVTTASPKWKQFTVISVESYTKPAYEHDGCCVTFLWAAPAEANIDALGDYSWQDMSDNESLLKQWKLNYATIV